MQILYNLTFLFLLHSTTFSFASFYGSRIISKIDTKSSISSSICCNWEEVNYYAKNRIVKTYFEQNVDEKQNCDIFCIDGVPAACMLYKNNTQDLMRQIKVDAFYINKGLILCFDAGSHMRHKLYKRHTYFLDIKEAVNRNIFLLI